MASFTLHDFRWADELLACVPVDAAVRFGRRAAELFPLNPQVYPPLIEALLRAGMKQEATQALARATGPSNPGAKLLMQFARLFARAGETEQARTLADAALADDPRSESAASLKARLTRKLEATPS